jgi:hypothetical protein
MPRPHGDTHPIACAAFVLALLLYVARCCSVTVRAVSMAITVPSTSVAIGLG